VPTLAVAGAVWIGPAALVADPQVGPAPEPTSEPAYSVYVDTTFEAQEGLRRFEEAAERAAWGEAVTRALELDAQYAGRLTRASEGRYVTIRRRVQDEIADWPDEARGVYARRIEATARQRLKEAMDERRLDDLVALADEYFASAVGTEAVEFAVQLALEAGEFASARQWLARFIARHPQRTQRAALWTAYDAAARAGTGDPVPLDALLSEASANGRPRGDDSFESAGRRIVLREYLAAARRALPAREGGVSLDSVIGLPNDAGEAASRLGTKAEAEARLWRAGGVGPVAAVGSIEAGPDGAADPPAEPAPRDSGAGDDDARVAADPRLTAMQPIYTGGRIIVHDHRNVWALDARREERPAWRYRIAGRPPVSNAWSVEDDPAPLFTTSADGERVYVPLDPRPADRLSRADAAGDASVLVCLSLAHGRLIWRNPLTALRTPFEEVRLDSAPLIVRDRLTALVRRRKQFGFETCYLAAFDRTDGRLLWRTHLGEAATGGYGYHRPTLSVPSREGDLVFVQTNLGTVAAVWASTGAVHWLRVYPASGGEGAESGRRGEWPVRIGRAVRPWHYGPPVCWSPGAARRGERHRVLAAPLDHDGLLVLDQEEGIIVERISIEILRRPEVIVGVVGDRLYCAGTWVVCYDLAAGRTAWERQLPEGELHGRPALTADGLYVPTTTALLHYPLEGGSPRRRGWEPSDAGNLLVLPSQHRTAAPGEAAPEDALDREWLSDQVVVAGADRVSGYVRREEAYARLESAAARAGADVRPLLRMAELAINLGDLERADACLGRANPSAGAASLGAADDGSRVSGEGSEGLRQRLFELYLGLARAMAEDVRPVAPGAEPAPPANRRRARVFPLLEAAGQLALTTREQVVFRLHLYREQNRAGRPVEAVRTAQQILGDPSLRSVSLTATDVERAGHAPVESREASSVPGWSSGRTREGAAGPPSGGDPDALTAGEWAARQIDALVSAHGHEVYAEAEREARLRFRAAAEGEDEAGLRRVAETYPNSGAAPEALHACARLLARRGVWRAAAAACKEALAFGERCDGVAVMGDLIEALSRGGRAAEAAEWMDRSRRRFGKAGPPDEGTPAAGGYRRAWRRDFAEAPLVLSPRFPGLPQTDSASVSTGTEANGGVVPVWSGRRLQILDGGTGRTRGEPIACRATPALLGSAAGRLILATRHEVIAVDPQSGAEAWRFGRHPPEADRPETDPEWLVGATDHLLTATALYVVLDRGELRCIEPRDGGQRWSVEAGGSVASPPAADERVVCYAVRDDRSCLIVVRSAATGERLNAMRLEEDRAILALRLVEPGGLAVLTSRTARVLNLPPGRERTVRWHVRLESRLVASGVETTPDALCLATETGGIVALRLEDGRRAWSAGSPAAPADASVWTALARGVLYAAGARTLVALDAWDGRTLSEVTDERILGPNSVTPPIRTQGAILCLSRRAPAAPQADGPGETRPRRANEYVLYRIAVAPGGGRFGLIEENVLGTLDDFRGLVAAGEAALIVDGAAVVGYVAEADQETDEAGVAPGDESPR